MENIPTLILTTVITSIVGTTITILIQNLSQIRKKKNVRVDVVDATKDGVVTIEEVKKENTLKNFFKKPLTKSVILYITAIVLAICPLLAINFNVILTTNTFLFWFILVAAILSILVISCWWYVFIKGWLKVAKLKAAKTNLYLFIGYCVGMLISILSCYIGIWTKNEFYFWLSFLCSIVLLVSISLVSFFYGKSSGKEMSRYRLLIVCMIIGFTSILENSIVAFSSNISYLSLYNTIFTYQKHYYMKNEDGTLAFVMSDYNETNLIIPSEVNGKAVTTLNFGPQYLEGNKDYISIVVPDSIETLPIAIFENCSKLERLTIPFIDWEFESGVNNYEGEARLHSRFGNLFGTWEYENSMGVEQSSNGIYITGDKAEQETTFVNTFYIPKSLYSVTVNGGNVQYGAFMNCSNITEIKLNVESVEQGAFTGCGAVQNYEGMSYVDNWVISSDKTLSTFTLKSETIGIADRAFESGALSKITLNENLKNIGMSAFASTKITDIKIPASVEIINKKAFSNCSKLSNAEFDNAVNWYADDVYVSSESLHNSQTAASYLTNKYKDAKWTRR